MLSSKLTGPFRSLVGCIFAEHPDVYNNLKDSIQNLSNTCMTQTDVGIAQDNPRKEMVEVNLHNLIIEFDQWNENYPMYKWTRMCIR